MTQSLIIDAVIDKFHDLQLTLNKVVAGIEQDSNLCAWMHEANSKQHYRTNAIYNLQQLEYTLTQDPKTVIIAPGLIGSSQNTLAAVADLNQAKMNFQAAIKEVKLHKIKLHDERITKPIDEILNNRNRSTSQVLHKFGLSRLNLKQCYRKLPILKAKPIKVSWTWANTRSIKKISRLEAEKLLTQKSNDEGIIAQLHKLASLNSKEPLAIVQELAPHLRANILYHDSRAMVKGPMPLFFPAKVGDDLPEYKPPKAKSARDNFRLTRSDTLLEDEPYLPAIRVHRYKNKQSA